MRQENKPKNQDDIGSQPEQKDRRFSQVLAPGVKVVTLWVYEKYCWLAYYINGEASGKKFKFKNCTMENMKQLLTIGKGFVQKKKKYGHNLLCGWAMENI